MLCMQGTSKILHQGYDEIQPDQIWQVLQVRQNSVYSRKLRVLCAQTAN